MGQALSEAMETLRKDVTDARHRGALPPPLPWGPVRDVLVEGHGCARHIVGLVVEVAGREVSLPAEAVSWEVMRCFDRLQVEMRVGMFARALCQVLGGVSPMEAAADVAGVPLAQDA